MIHDEKTAELEIPVSKQSSNVLPLHPQERKVLTHQYKGSSSWIPWLNDLDIEAPWILRLIAVLTILI
jgi:hypothetical protein